MVSESKFEPSVAIQFTEQSQTHQDATTSFEYIRKTTLDLLIGSWQLLAGIISGIIVFILIFIIFWKCELFKKVRFYDQQKQRLLRESQEMEDQNEEDKKMVEVDGEVVDLRS